MPKGTRVHRCTEKLKDKPGINEYAVCQKSTGQSYKTGKPLSPNKSRSAKSRAHAKV